MYFLYVSYFRAKEQFNKVSNRKYYLYIVSSGKEKMASELMQLIFFFDGSTEAMAVLGCTEGETMVPKKKGTLRARVYTRNANESYTAF